MRFNKVGILVALAAVIGASAPANAHFPVTLSNSHAKLSQSPILVDGTISFAVYANFTKAKEVRSFRFALRDNEELNLEYLILDQAPSNRLKNTQLPSVVITSPTGKKFNLAIKERTPFYEPFSKKKYLYLSRLSQLGEAGMYSVSMVAKARSSIVVAVGRTEVRGEVLQVGTSQGECPKPISQESEITSARALQLIGMSERAAEVCSSVLKWSYRVGERDGESFAVTMDFRPDRVTVSVQSGTITAVTVG